ncbi:MAG: aminotransferase class I/II-fold pyridoxal phosphate-dependent enzyme [Candidatus Lambdaproteobacteria bacterium]|nr:aminotransferase class I/II-fold pyridoxal phosphate-dependent enzyme [Candidatus Lambdaproteobacteria bacterium]
MSDSAFPIRLAERMSHLPDYIFERLNKIRHKLRQEGVDIIDMSMGNPRDPTPEPIVEKLAQVARDPRNHRYSMAAGIYNLRNELRKYYEAQYGVALDPEHEIIGTIGSKEGFSHLTLALLGPGERAIVPSPAYPIHSYGVVLAGGEPVPLNIEDDEAYLRNLNDYCARANPKPKVVFLNYPHNPTAKCVELSFFDEIVQLAKKHQFIVVHDLAYGRITFEGYVAPSFLQAKDALRVGCEFGTMSKTYNMAGWRIGYALGNREVIGALGRIKGYYDYGIFQAVQIAAIIALRHCEPYVAEQVALYQRRRDIVVQSLRQAGWQVSAPMGGMFVWVKLPEPFAKEGSEAFAMRAIEEAHVVVSPGVAFGPEGEGNLRMAIVENEKRLRQAMRSFRQAFSLHQPLRQAL